LFNRKMEWPSPLSRWSWRGIYRALSRNQPLGSYSNPGHCPVGSEIIWWELSGKNGLF
jgi:hypothetical protein